MQTKLILIFSLLFLFSCSFSLDDVNMKSSIIESNSKKNDLKPENSEKTIITFDESEIELNCAPDLNVLVDRGYTMQQIDSVVANSPKSYDSYLKNMKTEKIKGKLLTKEQYNEIDEFTSWSEFNDYNEEEEEIGIDKINSGSEYNNYEEDGENSVDELNSGSEYSNYEEDEFLIDGSNTQDETMAQIDALFAKGYIEQQINGIINNYGNSYDTYLKNMKTEKIEGKLLTKEQYNEIEDIIFSNKKITSDATNKENDEEDEIILSDLLKFD